MDVVKDIAAVIGLVLSSASLLAIVCRPLRNGLQEFIVQKSGKTETQAKLDDLQGKIDVLKSMMESHLEADIGKQKRAENDRTALLCLLRNQITEIYYTYLPSKEIPVHQYKNMILLYDAYDHEGGNTYVATIVDDMREWRVIPE